MIPLAIPNLAGKEGEYLQECVETNFVSSVGPFVDRFEKMVADQCGTSHAVATSSGTTGLHAALVAAGVGRDDLVILPSFTFIASANAVSMCGASPWLLDVSATSWTLDPIRLRDALNEETQRSDAGLVHKSSGRRVAAVMPVYTLGLPADMDPIVSLARDAGIRVVADAAAALGATYRERPVGSLGADLTVFSFNGNKTVTAGGGGAVAGNDKALVDLVRHLTTTARSSTEYDHDRIAFNYRMTNLQAAVGCAQMAQLNTFVAAKRRIAQRYDRELGGLPRLGRFPSPEWAHSACWFSGVTVPGGERPHLIDALRRRDVDARPFWKPIHLQRPYVDAPRSTVTECERVAPGILTLPCSTALTDGDQTTVIEAVKAILDC